MPFRGDLTETTVTVFRQFSWDLGEVARHFGATTVRLSDSPVGAERIELYDQDNRLPPNARGTDVITERVRADGTVSIPAVTEKVTIEAKAA